MLESLSVMTMDYSYIHHLVVRKIPSRQIRLNMMTNTGDLSGNHGTGCSSGLRYCSYRPQIAQAGHNVMQGWMARDNALAPWWCKDNRLALYIDISTMSGRFVITNSNSL
jgi:hypothetical protein